MKPLGCHCVKCGFTSSARSAAAIEGIAADHVIYCAMNRAREAYALEQASAVAGHGSRNTVVDQSSQSREVGG
jgi:hypothetical protein